MKNFFASVTFCLLTICFGILWLAVLVKLEQDTLLVKYFSVAFIAGCLSFLAYLKLENNKN